MKKLLSILLTIALLISVSPMGAFTFTASATGNFFAEGYYTYTVENGEATITAVDESISGDITIPSTLGGYPVRVIMQYAFINHSNITSISIPKNVTKIFAEAFYSCENLANINVSKDNKNYSSIDGVLFNKEVTVLVRFPEGKNLSSYIIPSSVTEVGYCSFRRCNYLTSVTLPNSVTTISAYAFRDCSNLVDVNLSNNIKSIDVEAFAYCKSLNNITIPNNVKCIEEGAFEGCSSLTSILIPDSTYLKQYPFRWCKNLTDINVSENNPYHTAINGVLFNKDITTLIQYPAGKIDTLYTIPASVTSIGPSAFSGCAILANITIPDSVTYIGSGAFNDCTNLTSITIPDSVTSIESYTFISCTNLISVSLPNSITDIGIGAFENCKSLEIIAIPEGVEILWNVTFDFCTSLTNIIMPISVTYVGGGVFTDAPLSDVWYMGSEEDRERITTNDNIYLALATWHYNTCKPNEHTYISNSDTTCENCEWVRYDANGDIGADGAINNKDLGILMQYLNDWNVEINTDAADVNDDGSINNKDYGLLMQYLNGWDIELK